VGETAAGIPCGWPAVAGAPDTVDSTGGRNAAEPADVAVLAAVEAAPAAAAGTAEEAAEGTAPGD
jgi:hypothetical protein